MTRPFPPLLQFAEDVLQGLVQDGAGGALVRIVESTSIEASVGGSSVARETGPETQLYARVSRDGRTIDASEAALTPDAIERLRQRFLGPSDLWTCDAGSIPESEDLPPTTEELQLFDESFAEMSLRDIEVRVDRCANAAREYDDRIAKLLLIGMNRRINRVAIACSSGMRGEYRSTIGGQSALCLAREAATGEQFILGDARDVRRKSDLADPNDLGRSAARRAVSGLGGRQIDDTTAPVIIDSLLASTILGVFGDWISGDALLNLPSYYVSRLGSAVASSIVTIADDPLIPAGPGSRPFDAEGVPSRRNVVVADRKLQSFLLDTATARRLGMRSTASARGADPLGRRADISNLLMEEGKTTLDAMIRAVSRGMYATFARIVRVDPGTTSMLLCLWGQWIESGECAFPVSNVMCSITLDQLFQRIDDVADDRPLFRRASSPSFRVAEMELRREPP